MQLSTLAVLFMLQALFAFCYLGQILHSNLIDLPDAIYQSNWYRHTRCFQRFILLMLMLSQQPFYISAFGIMRCNLENFVGVSIYADAVFRFSYFQHIDIHWFPGHEIGLFRFDVIAKHWRDLMSLWGLFQSAIRQENFALILNFVWKNIWFGYPGLRT